MISREKEFISDDGAVRLHYPSHRFHLSEVRDIAGIGTKRVMRHPVLTRMRACQVFSDGDYVTVTFEVAA